MKPWICILIASFSLVACKVTSQAPGRGGEGGPHKPGGVKEVAPGALIPSFGGGTRLVNTMGSSVTKEVGALKKRFGFRLGEGKFLKINRVEATPTDCEEKALPEAEFMLKQGEEVIPMKVMRQVAYQQNVEGELIAYLYNVGICDALSMRFSVQVENDPAVGESATEAETCLQWEITTIEGSEPLYSAIQVPCR